MSDQTILHRLHRNIELRPDKPAYYEKLDVQWQPTSWRQHCQEVRQIARGLVALGLETGDKAAILGYNRSEWVTFDLAAMLAGGVAVGIYTTNSPAEVAYVLEHSGARFVLLENEAQWAKVEAHWNELPELQYVVMMRRTAVPDHERVLGWEDLIRRGVEVSEEEIDNRLNALTMDQLATLIYTSGTTGPPKGVMLSHLNLAWTAQTAVDMASITEVDHSVSYLPLSHIAEQMFTIHGPTTAGYPIYYIQYPPQDYLADNLREVQPTILFGVPRIWERFYSGVAEALSQAEGARARIAQWAQGIGSRVSDLRTQGQEPTGSLALQYRLADRLFFARVHERLGFSACRFFVSGAAPIRPDILEFFAGLDIIVHEVYGQSEGSGPTTFNQPGRARLGSVGPPYPGSQVKISEDGEVMLRGPNVFMGYFQDPDASQQTLVDEWLLSGDLGAFDEDGFLYITGRKKDIIITSGGKNIAPKNIEAALKAIDLVADAIVIGEGRRYLTALLTLDEAAATLFAGENHLDAAELHTQVAILESIQEGIDRVNAELARVEQVRKFELLPESFSINGGELTPTLKLKRQVVVAKYASEIEELYEG